jgi:Domain of unknown function (DUF4282)
MSNPYGGGQADSLSGGYPGPPAAATDPTSTGFFAGLFDLSFTKFITIKFIRLIYILCIIATAASLLFMIIAGFAVGPLFGILALVLGAILCTIGLTLYRITLEFFVVVFRISDDVHALRSRAHS